MDSEKVMEADRKCAMEFLEALGFPQHVSLVDLSMGLPDGMGEDAVGIIAAHRIASTEALREENACLKAALTRADELCRVALPTFNWGASALTADAEPGGDVVELVREVADIIHAGIWRQNFRRPFTSFDSCCRTAAILLERLAPAAVRRDALEKHRFGSPPEPVVNPSSEWLEAYADWYYQGKS